METGEVADVAPEAPRERVNTRLVREAIAHVIARRREQLPLMEAKLEAWRTLDRRLGDLDAALEDMLLHPSTPVELRASVSDFRHRDLRQRVAECVSKLVTVRGRMSRSTVNIGVSGQARVGKSTLLQSIAGLGEEQIPTGEGIPVTAVRSRIFHSTTHARATVALHTFATFRQNVLAPYHRELALAEPPDTLDAFRRSNGAVPEETLAEINRDFTDLLALVQNFQTGTIVEGDLDAFSSEFASDWALVQALAPEPMSLTLLTFLGLGARRYR